MYPIFTLLLSPYFLFTGVIFLLWHFCTSSYGYWKKADIKFKEPVPFFGNIAWFALLLQPYHEALHQVYTYFQDDPFGGFFQMRDPVLLIRDPDLVHTVLVKDFKNFYDRGFDFAHPSKDLNPLSLHLFMAQGDRWRALRRKMSPIFTSGKLKSMHSQMTDCVNKLNTMLDKELQGAGNVNLNLKAVFERLTIDVIGSCAFGIECSSLEKNDEFRVMGNKVFQPTWVNSARMLMAVISKKLLKCFQLPDFPKDVTTFFQKLVFDTIQYRRKNNVARSDLLQLLMELQNAWDDPNYTVSDQKTSILGDERFDEVHIAANSFLFFFAGYETTASTLSFCLYELALNQSVQDRLHDEVVSLYGVSGDTSLQIGTLKEMPYLDAVLSETLRKYPPLPWLIRTAEEDYLIPNTCKVIPKGTRVIIPTWSIQHDWKHYQNPELFNPDRFYGDNLSKIRNGTYMPFGDGPRNCIGARFARMEMRIALADAILRYKFTPCSRTRIPISFANGSVLMTIDEGIWVNISKRKI